MTMTNPNDERIPAMKVLRTAMDECIGSGDGAYSDAVSEQCHMYLTVLTEFLNEDANMNQRQAYQVVNDLLGRILRKERIDFSHGIAVANYINGCKA